MSKLYDAVVVGAGPNGLAAAIHLARAGCSVLLLEAKGTVGGGMRSAQLTLPGFTHDICSAIHPLALASPFMKTLPLQEYGLEWIFAPAELAHPLDGGAAVEVVRSTVETGQTLGRDAGAYQRLMGLMTASCDKILAEVLGPLRFPRHPIALTEFAIPALMPATMLVNLLFRDDRARAVFMGMAAHSILPLEQPATAAYGLMLGMLAHTVGWPLAKGGSQRIADAMAAYFCALGGQIVTDQPVRSLDDLPESSAVLLDVTPRQLLSIAGDRLPDGYRRRLAGYRYGPGVFKMDFALDGPIPWTAEACKRAATVHLGGTAQELAASERAIWRGRHPEKPYVLLAQHSLFDPTRAPAGKHTAWAYCHVPNGSTVDMSDAIEAQIERFAPGFRDLILAKSTRTATDMERYNANYIGGDINGGVQDLRQLFTRPVARRVPYSTPARGIYLCSSSTPPGGGVHGMCGYHAARAVLRLL